MLGAAAAATTAIVLTTAGAGSGFGAENAAQIAVSALPGADLGELERLPGLAATSGPFPTVATGVRYGRHTADVTLEGRAGPRSAVGGLSLSYGVWKRSGALVLDQDVARAIGAWVGARITISTVDGPARLRLGGITAGASHLPGRAARGYVSMGTLERVAPNRRTWSSTLYLLLADPRSSSRYAQWISAAHPAPQATVDVLRGSGQAPEL